MKKTLARCTPSGITRRVAFIAVVASGACGGRIDSVSERSSGPSATATSGRRPPGGGIPARPPTVPTSSESAAAQIAEAHCKTFSSCCVGAKLPPIDVARCREITSAAVAVALDQFKSGEMNPTDVLQCVDAIKTRTAACGKEDYPWWRLGDVALFGPPNIQKACAALVGLSMKTVRGEACTAKTACAGAETCAVDICVPGVLLGESCATEPCLDGAMCTGGVCARGSEATIGDACNVDEECRLGLVCSKNMCAPARSQPELYEERHSPYRVGADTCRAFTDL